MAKIKLVENFSRDWQEPLKIKRLALKEAVQPIEYDGKEYKATEGFEIPIWRLGKKNLNGRIYPKALGEKVVKEFKNLITINLADHPDGDGSVKDIYAISKNPHIKEDILYVDTYPVDPVFETKLNKMLELGAGLGVSSSCFGDLNEKTGEIIEEGFEVERWHDFVTTPSFEVYVTEDCRIKEEINSKKEVIQESLTTHNEENSTMSDKLKELNEKTTRLNLMKLIEEAEKKENLSEKISALNEALIYTAEDFLPDVRESLIEKVESLNKEAFELAEKAKTIPRLEESVAEKDTANTAIVEKVSLIEAEFNQLQEKYTVATSLLDESKEFAKKADDLLIESNADKNSRFSAKEYLELAKINESLSASLTEKETVYEKLSEEFSESQNLVSRLRSRIKDLKEKVSEQEAVIADYKAEIEAGLMNEEPEEELINYENDDSFDYSDGLGKEDVGDLDIYNTSVVSEYYESLVTTNPNYRKIKEDVLKCKTLFEAQRTVMRLGDLVDKVKMPSVLSESRANEKRSKDKEVDVSKIIHKGWL